jgi:hypothetical protein
MLKADMNLKNIWESELQVWRKLKVHTKSVFNTITGKNEKNIAPYTYGGTPQGSMIKLLGNMILPSLKISSSCALNSGSGLFCIQHYQS